MQTAAAAEQDNRSNYQKLRVAIEASDGILNLLIAVCDDRTLREQLIQQYETELPQKGIHPYQIRVRYQGPSLRQALARLVALHPALEGQRAVISVLGVDDLLTVKLDDDRSEQERFFGYLQWTREALLQFRYPIVLWVSNTVLARLADRAPDFWSWRGGVFWFTSPLQARVEAQIEHARSLATAKGLLDPQTTAAWDAVKALQAERADRPTHPDRLPASFEAPLPEDPTGLPVDELQQLIAQIEHQQGSDAPLLATLYDSLGRAYKRRLDHSTADDYIQERQRAIDAFERAIALQTKLGLENDLINSLIFVGELYRFRHQFEIAAAHYERAFHLAKKLGNRWAEGAVLNNLGLAYQSLGRYQQAIESHQKSLVIKQENGDRQGEAKAFGNLGNAYYFLGQYERAIEFQQQSLEIERELGDRQGEANSLGNLGIAYDAQGQYDRAIEFLQQHLALARELGDKRGEANAIGNLGIAYKNLGQYDRAIEFFQQHLALARELGARQGEASVLGNLGVAYKNLEQYDWAIELQQQSLEIKRELGDKRGEANALGNLGNAYQNLGQYERAIEFLKQQSELARELGDKRGEANSLWNIGLTLAKLDQKWQAVDAYQAALKLFQAMGLDEWVQNCQTAIKEVHQVISPVPLRAPRLTDAPLPTPEPPTVQPIRRRKRGRGFRQWLKRLWHVVHSWFRSMQR